MVAVFGRRDRHDDVLDLRGSSPPPPSLVWVDAHLGSVTGEGGTHTAPCPCGCGRTVVDTGGHLLAATLATRSAAARLEAAVRHLAMHAPDDPHFRTAARMLSETRDLNDRLVEWCHGDRSLSFGRQLHTWSLQWAGRYSEIDTFLTETIHLPG